MARISVTTGISIDEGELEESFIQSAGPGGQNVNKVATAVQLRFNVLRSPSLPDHVRERLMRLAGRKMTKDGVLVVTARRFRSQERNRDDARERVVELIREAAFIAPPRRETKPPRAAKKRLSEAKKKHSALKRLRSRPGSE
jgi:ribosome-associated protein